MNFLWFAQHNDLTAALSKICSGFNEEPDWFISSQIWASSIFPETGSSHQRYIELPKTAFTILQIDSPFRSYPTLVDLAVVRDYFTGIREMQLLDVRNLVKGSMIDEREAQISPTQLLHAVHGILLILTYYKIRKLSWHPPMQMRLRPAVGDYKYGKLIDK
ncbi:hypothetical protein BJ508DRAFT_304768 [Ascobolus immersus RN42]|uniref:Uncharacterized protein n=1 Tax=Ascobolus immersus RN42 TaxID=1160509 RepID=A0A3N4IGN3_ASCIM|nr:hypothetical protein BJ508DRAFT_304768 [Ascobolus immersus RN42]